MARFVVMERPGDGANAVIIRDAFSVFALVLPVVWLLWHRLWFAALAAFSLAALGALAAWHFAFPPAAFAGELIVSLFVALEGPSLRRHALEAQGFREAGVVHADGAEEAEIRWFAERHTAAEPSSSAPLYRAIETGRGGGATGNAAFAFPTGGRA
ncbi:MAG: DUF2628 domain-containing protein [Rhizobiaceae bacterium]|jgi:hypothetical protein|nr:DUF2628 domain-containing protein [Rhizobiaceae bacterium]